ncbi:hydrolase, HD family [Leptospira ryugenii]|uniref:bis(5'-nucleosyl)-tetraphosphatase (symmetrical) n=1 Tax=Leptospira ryugenii TaxID=1917863 RepID=A0A2P2DX05_9LEPT|nr:bis(5'-nucleosyl)-tetraphosphatase (symmetrical) YqeK [Leptospira ryugenii]GBF49169.1 hydrolase, HD family [Leptospira ryugenii]
MSEDDWIEFFSKEVPKHITESRWQHCLRVANFAKRLSDLNHNQNQKKAYLAGILHDITKQKKTEFHLDLFGIKNLLDQVKTMPKEAYHAWSAPIYIEIEFGYQDASVFQAIRSHTMGGKNMGLLEKILYASDFLGSEYAGRQELFPFWVEKVEKDLNFGVNLKASQTINNLIESKRPISETTLETYHNSLPKNTE